MYNSNFSIHPLGCSGVICYLGHSISEETNDLVHRFKEYVNQKIGSKLEGIVPSYHSITFYFNSLTYEYEHIKKELEISFSELVDYSNTNKRVIHHIPVCYDLRFGSEIKNVANQNKLSIKEVIRLHTEPVYRIYMIGFLPGFPYLGGLNSKLSTPRLTKPKIVDKGSVGIAGQQTGIYPIQSPGGWNIIGRTPLSIFSVQDQNSETFMPGDYIKFHAVTLEKYESIQEMVITGRYKVHKEVHFVEKNN